jgi:hypothetical protein
MKKYLLFFKKIQQKPNCMKLLPFVKSSLVLILFFSFFSGCEKMSIRYISLDNQSDYTVTVKLYTGNDDNQGYMIYEPYIVSAHNKKQVESKTSWVYVNGYVPSESVDMEIDGSKIIFTNL